MQPLAGEFAAPRALLCDLPFLTGYGVELALLIDVLGEMRPTAQAQGDGQNRHQPLWDLTRMSSTVLRAMARRLPGPAGNATDPRDGDVLGLDRETYLHAVATGAGLRLDEHLNELVERPALASVLGARDSVA